MIDIPDSGTSPNWSPAIIEAFQAIATALAAVLGPNDISPQLYNIDAFNSVTNQPITNLSFSTASVRAAHIRYYVFRSTTLAVAYEVGTLMVVYNATNPTNNKWEIVREYAGNGSITFSITDAGQVQFSTTALTGTSHTGKIGFSALTLNQS